MSKATPPQFANTDRREGRPRPVAAALSKVTRRALGRRGLSEGALMVDWPAIVGEALCRRCVPLKLSFADRARRSEGTLTLQVEPAWALELQHIAPQLIERINASLGYRAVARLALQQAPVSRAAAEEPKPGSHGRAPRSETTGYDRVAGIEDEELRGALVGLGRSLQTRDDG